MALTYDQLLRIVPVTMMAQNRTLVDEMPDIIRRAEDEIILRIDHDAFKTRLPNLVALTPGQAEVDLAALPFSILEVRSLRLVVDESQTVLERRNAERMEAMYPRWERGVPRFYAEDGSTLMFRLFPAPDLAYQIEVHANVEPQRLAPETQETLLTRQYPRLVEMSVLRHAAVFMRNPADENRFANLLDLALAEANSVLARKRRDETGTKPVNTSNIG